MAFRIDGSVYEVPELGTFTMGEALILYDNTGLSLESFVLDADDPKQAQQFTKAILHPGTVFSRMVVAYLRGNPGASREQAEAIIEKGNWLEAYLQYTAEFGSDASPPGLESSREERPTSSPIPSGETSPESLAAQDDPRASTGTSE